MGHGNFAVVGYGRVLPFDREIAGDLDDHIVEVIFNEYRDNPRNMFVTFKGKTLEVETTIEMHAEITNEKVHPSKEELDHYVGIMKYHDVEDLPVLTLYGYEGP